MRITELKRCIRCGAPLKDGTSVYCDGPVVDGFQESCRKVMEKQMTVIRLILDDGSTGPYLENFDPEFAQGRGFASWTKDVMKAKLFQGKAEAWEFWKTQSKTRPLREDGKPNRPLTAFSVSLEEVGKDG